MIMAGDQLQSQIDLGWSGIHVSEDQTDYKPYLHWHASQALKDSGQMVRMLLTLIHPGRDYFLDCVQRMAFKNELTIGKLLSWEASFNQRNTRTSAYPFYSLRQIIRLLPGFKKTVFQFSYYELYHRVSTSVSLKTLADHYENAP